MMTFEVNKLLMTATMRVIANKHTVFRSLFDLDFSKSRFPPNFGSYCQSSTTVRTPVLEYCTPSTRYKYLHSPYAKPYSNVFVRATVHCRLPVEGDIVHLTNI